MSASPKTVLHRHRAGQQRPAASRPLSSGGRGSLQKLLLLLTGDCLCRKGKYLLAHLPLSLPVCPVLQRRSGRLFLSCERRYFSTFMLRNSELPPSLVLTQPSLHSRDSTATGSGAACYLSAVTRHPGCSSPVSHITCWLETTDLFPQVLEAGTLRPRCQQGLPPRPVPPPTPGLPGGCLLFPAASGCQQAPAMAASLRPVSVSLCLSVIKTSPWHSGPLPQ